MTSVFTVPFLFYLLKRPWSNSRFWTHHVAVTWWRYCLILLKTITHALRFS